MASGFVNRIQKYSLYILSAVMGLGTINPFEAYNPDEEPKSFLIYPALILIILSFVVDKNSFRIRYNKIAKSELSLLFLWITILFSGIVYKIRHPMSVEISYEYYLKMLFAFIAYYIVTILFIRTKDNYNNLLIYSITCLLLVIPFFGDTAVSDFYYFSNGRLVMYGENPNSFSARLGIAVLFLSYSLTDGKKKYIYKIFAIIAIIILLYFILLSGSRGSFAIVAFCSIIMFAKRLTLQQLFFVFIPILVICIYVVIGNSAEFYVFQRFEALQENGNPREVLMSYAIDIWESFPIIGCGQNGYLTEKIIRFNNPLDSHCIVTSVMAMGGVIGLFWFIRFILLNFISAWRISKINNFPIILFLFMLFVSLKTGGIITYFLMYYIYAFVASEGYVYGNKQRIRLIPKRLNEYSLYNKSQYQHSGRS